MGTTTARDTERLLTGLVQDQAGLGDFWNVYDANYALITDETASLLANDPEFGPLIAAMSEEDSARQNRESRERLGRAILDGAWDEYFADLRTQGATYAQLGITFTGWFRVVNMMRPRLLELLVEAFGETPERMRASIVAMDSFIDAAMAIIGEEYLHAKELIIRQQQEAIRDLSTPVLQLSDELLLLPVVGVIDSDRARQMTDQLLHAIRASRAKVVVIDITGVPALDSMVANHLLQAAEAARLLGARAILTGLSAEVAQTVVRIGVDLSKVETTGNLQVGVEEANRFLGYRLVRVESGAA